VIDSYIGVDIVDSVVQQNQARYTSQHVSFDFITEKYVPKPVDLIICRDVFHHLPNYVVINLMDMFLTHAKYVMVTTDYFPYSDNKNPDCYFGGYRPIDLSAAPFNYTGVELLSTTDGLQNYAMFNKQEQIQNNIVKKTILFKRK
jgi:hypothetical protein